MSALGLKTRFSYAWASSLTGQDRRALATMSAVVIGLHLLGITTLVAVTGTDGTAGTSHHTFGIGVGVLAYTFGLRHAFDADHIAAIDNVTRKLEADRNARGDADRPLTVGFWFSLGHSSIVFALAVALSAGVKSMSAPISDPASTLHAITGVIGPLVSGTFLWILGLVNVVALVGIVGVYREMQRGHFDEETLEAHLDARGLISRILRPLSRSTRRPWHAYVIGLLFGLGFDTATEVGLLVLAGGAAALNLPFYAIATLPLLFAAAMCLMDSLDGCFMNLAYGWAFAQPARKIFYNLTVTSISVLVALAIGTLELVGVLAAQLHITSGPLAAAASINLDYAGYAIVAIFMGTWLAALTIWRLGRFDQSTVIPGEQPPQRNLSGTSGT